MSFEPCSNFSRTTNCSICCEDFSRKTHRNALVHKDAAGRAIHPIHANCLQDLLRSSLENANTPPTCPLCREQITHVNGKPVQRIQRTLADAPMDPLTSDAIGAINGMPDNAMPEDLFNELEYRHRENQRLLSQRFLQSLIPGRIECLRRRNLFPEGHRSAIFAQYLKWHRDMTYIFVCPSLMLLGISLFLLSRNDYAGAFSMGTAAAAVGCIAKTPLRNLHQSVDEYGEFLFPTEADQE